MCFGKANDRRLISQRRRGVATIWFLAGLPAVIGLFLFLLELGHLWSARVELENSLEAAALAAAKSWGTSGGAPAANWTNTARLRAQSLAAANTINGVPVLIGTNLGTYNVASNPNENATYTLGVGAPGTGNLVFGAVTDSGGITTFDATTAPSCGGATVMIDATGAANLDSGLRNSWGIAFQAAASPALRITRIEIDLRPIPPTTFPLFHYYSGTAQLNTSIDSFATAAVKDSSGNFQQDNVGFPGAANNMLAGQIVASYPNIQVLRLDFSAGGGDDGFAPGDRFRFSQGVNGLVFFPRDGDEVGGALVTITFNDGTIASATLVDTTNTGAINPRQIDPITGTFIVNTALVPDLPVQPTNDAANNGQSYVRVMSTAGATGYFGVRAQASLNVPSLFGSYFGALYSSHLITVETTAIFDCSTGRPELVLIDDYIHP